MAIEEALGEAAAIVGLSILTGGAVDAFFFTDAAVDGVVDAGEEGLELSVTAEASQGSDVAENILTDSWFEEMGDLNAQDVLNDYLNVDPDRPVIEEVDEVPFANRGLRPNPDAAVNRAANKMIAQAFTGYGFG